MSETNYSGLSGPDFLTAVGDDYRKWAAAFCQLAGDAGKDLDRGWVETMFANAMQMALDVYTGRSPVPLPDTPLMSQRDTSLLDAFMADRRNIPRRG